MSLYSEMMDEASAMSGEISRLNALLAKIGRSWSSGNDEQFGGRFLCIHGLTPQEKDELVDAGLASLALTSKEP